MDHYEYKARHSCHVVLGSGNFIVSRRLDLTTGLLMINCSIPLVCLFIIRLSNLVLGNNPIQGLSVNTAGTS